MDATCIVPGENVDYYDFVLIGSPVKNSCTLWRETDMDYDSRTSNLFPVT